MNVSNPNSWLFRLDDPPRADLGTALCDNMQGSDDELVIEPTRDIVDPHHHLWDAGTSQRPSVRYLLDEFLRDAGNCGHNITATVYIECNSMYRKSGPKELQSLGEIEFANGVAAMSASGNYGPIRACEGIVGFADLSMGASVRDVLERQIETARDRFRGIRHGAAWDADDSVRPGPTRPPKGLLLDSRFRKGFSQLKPLNLSFDAWVFPAQLPELADLAKAFPETAIVLNHVGAPRGTGVYAGKSGEMLELIAKGIACLKSCDNVFVKLGGLGTWSCGFPLYGREPRAGSAELAEAWQPYIEPWIQSLGPDRAMFESNFPPDRMTCTYKSLWNAFKIISAKYSESEKNALFADTARKVYRLPAR